MSRALSPWGCALAIASAALVLGAPVGAYLAGEHVQSVTDAAAYQVAATEAKAEGAREQSLLDARQAKAADDAVRDAKAQEHAIAATTAGLQARIQSVPFHGACQWPSQATELLRAARAE